MPNILINGFKKNINGEQYVFDRHATTERGVSGAMWTVHKNRVILGSTFMPLLTYKGEYRSAITRAEVIATFKQKWIIHEK